MNNVCVPLDGFSLIYFVYICRDAALLRLQLCVHLSKTQTTDLQC